MSQISIDKTCDRCGDRLVDRFHTLRNPYYNNGTVSKIRSRMNVCQECYEAMIRSPHWEL